MAEAVESVLLVVLQQLGHVRMRQLVHGDRRTRRAVGPEELAVDLVVPAEVVHDPEHERQPRREQEQQDAELQAVQRLREEEAHRQMGPHAPGSRRSLPPKGAEFAL